MSFTATLLSHAAPQARSLTDATVAVVGLGYVGLPTSLALHAAGARVIGIDASDTRLRDIADRHVDLLESDHSRLAGALGSDRLTITADAARLAEADVVLVCVPTPVTPDLQPDLRPLRGACATVLRHLRRGQTVVLTSTSYVGTTRELVCAPLEARGWVVGRDVFVCFSPERIDPGNRTHTQEQTPRVLGGATSACAERASGVLAAACGGLRTVSSIEAAEMCKLLENTFRAVNIAFADEMATAAQHYGLDPIEVIEAAGTKPYGFMAFYPSAGVGGHCIPCDPHYLLKPLARAGVPAPMTDMAMTHIAERPAQVAERALGMIVADGIDIDDARVLVVGAAYKPGVADAREAPALAVIDRLAGAGCGVDYHDPLIPVLDRPHGSMVSVADPSGADYDAVVLVTVHPGADIKRIATCPRVLDGTYRRADVTHRELV